jgi:hypothetical protein
MYAPSRFRVPTHDSRPCITRQLFTTTMLPTSNYTTKRQKKREKEKEKEIDTEISFALSSPPPKKKRLK